MESAEPAFSSEGKTLSSGRKPRKPWTVQEHKLFLAGLQTFKKGNWKNISKFFVVTKTPTQVASHAQKYFNRQTVTPSSRCRPTILDITTVDSSIASLFLAKPENGFLVPNVNNTKGVPHSSIFNYFPKHQRSFSTINNDLHQVIAGVVSGEGVTKVAQGTLTEKEIYPYPLTNVDINDPVTITVEDYYPLLEQIEILTPTQIAENAPPYDIEVALNSNVTNNGIQLPQPLASIEVAQNQIANWNPITTFARPMWYPTLKDLAELANFS